MKSISFFSGQMNRDTCSLSQVLASANEMLRERGTEGWETLIVFRNPNRSYSKRSNTKRPAINMRYTYILAWETMHSKSKKEPYSFSGKSFLKFTKAF
jgi:hypothetical protein